MRTGGRRNGQGLPQGRLPHDSSSQPRTPAPPPAAHGWGALAPGWNPSPSVCVQGLPGPEGVLSLGASCGPVLPDASLAPGSDSTHLVLWVTGLGPVLVWSTGPWGEGSWGSFGVTGLYPSCLVLP